jgi:hypothetical protein
MHPDGLPANIKDGVGLHSIHKGTWVIGYHFEEHFFTANSASEATSCTDLIAQIQECKDRLVRFVQCQGTHTSNRRTLQHPAHEPFVWVGRQE